MTQDNSAGSPRQPTASSPMSERMQALLSKAAEEQLNEQRQVSTVLTDLRELVTGLGEQLRGTASSSRLDSLGKDVSSLVTERVADLGADVAAQGAALDRLTASLSSLSALPDSLAQLQRELSGLQDRLAPLEQVRSGVADLTARTGALEALRPEVAAVGQRLTGLATADVLRSALAPVLDRLEEMGGGAPVVERLYGIDTRLDVLRERFDALGERLTVVGEAAGGVPAVAADLARVAARVEEVAELRAEVAGLRTGVTALQEDAGLPTLVLGVAALRNDVEQLGRRVSQVVVPTPGDVAAAVSQQVTDRLVDELAPRVADQVLTRVASTLVEQVADSVTSSVQNGLTEKVRAASADSERRLSAHVDEAILVLAEALLRRRRSGRGTTASVLVGLAEPDPQEGKADLEAAVPEAAREEAPAPSVVPAATGPTSAALAEPELSAEVAPAPQDRAYGTSEAHSAPSAARADGQLVDDEVVDDEVVDDEAADDGAADHGGSPAQPGTPSESAGSEVGAPPRPAPSDDEEQGTAAQTEDGPAAPAGEPSGEAAGAAAAAPAVRAGDGDASSLVDSPAAPASAFRFPQAAPAATSPASSTGPSEPSGPETGDGANGPLARPAPPARPIPAVQRVTPSASAPVGVPPASEPRDQTDESDDEVEDGPRRRPWWRPGG
ncbi:MAG: hypothetical protein ACR2K2_15140 [Mycobacteriales bacterium]